MEEIGYWPIITWAIGGGAVTLVVRELWASALRYMDRENIASHLAIRLATMYEAYAFTCASKLADGLLFDESGGHAGTNLRSLPKMPELPESDQWETLSSSLLDSVLTFPLLHRSAEASIGDWADIDPECIPEAARDKTASIGYQAWLIAGCLRKHYGFRALSPDGVGWDFPAYLKGRKEKAEKRERAMAED